MTTRFTRGARVLLACAPLAPLASAHDGPPYPILVDQPAGPLVVSIWGDPDVGIGTFYFYLEPAHPGPLPDTTIEVFARPRDGAREEASTPARAAGERDSFQMIAEVPFDTREWWTTRFVFRTAQGDAELSTDVEVTPPGFGKLDLLWYLAPFLAVAFLWGKAILQRRRYYAQEARERDVAAGDDEASAARE